MRVTITEPQDEGDIVIVSEVKTKVAGSANAKTNSLRLSNMIIPFPRMNEVGQKAQTAMNTILMFER